MMPGDHLQFLYHLWLAKDTFLGPTPLFHNLYEFNTGDDAGRYEVSRYYFPFSLFFAPAAALAGQAFGWNAAGFISLWITLIFTGLLARRYTPDRLVAVTAAVIAIIVPYRWYTLLGGSPTGLAMMWAPIALYGLDVMAGDKKMWGGALAAASIYLSGWSDTHVFYFLVLLSPAWCVFTWLYRTPTPLFSRRELARLFRAALPIFLVVGLILLQALKVKNKFSHTAAGSTGRSLNEINIFSPHLSGALFHDSTAVDGTIYLGFFMIALVLAGFAALVSLKPGLDRARHPRLAGLLLLLALAGVVLMATGPNNPGGPLWWSRIIRFVPGYGMIRQTAKIYCVVPTLLSVLLALELSALLRFINRRWICRLACLGVLAVLAWDYGMRIDPTLCLLDPSQGAYKAVADDAARRGIRPHLLALPLWPGNSAFTSINQYYISLYRIRMINGYRPTVGTNYIESVFRRFESFNKGIVGDDQLDDLLRRGIHYVLLHEDVFPEKVSPFAVGVTLKLLLNHPRLALLEQDRSAWTFRILAAPEERPDAAPDWTYCFPSRRYELERYGRGDAAIVTNESASGGRCLALAGTNAWFSVPIERLPPLPGLRWLVRVRGEGLLRVLATNDLARGLEQEIAVHSADWRWIELPIPTAAGLPQSVWPDFIAEAGVLEADLLILAAGPWTPLEKGQSLRLPAACFFHAGYTDRRRDAVILRRDYDPESIVFYGPKLPFEKGTYRIELVFETQAPAGTPLGRFNLRQRESDEGNWTPVVAGETAVALVTQQENMPVFLAFLFARNADLALREVLCTRLE